MTTVAVLYFINAWFKQRSRHLQQDDRRLKHLQQHDGRLKHLQQDDERLKHLQQHDGRLTLIHIVVADSNWWQMSATVTAALWTVRRRQTKSGRESSLLSLLSGRIALWLGWMKGAVTAMKMTIDCTCRMIFFFFFFCVQFDGCVD